MNNNDILRSLRYTFDLNDDKMIRLFGNGALEVTRAQVSDWLKPEGDPSLKPLYDKELAAFLNGLIIHKRGAQEGEPPKPEKSLNNNIVLRKLKIALSLRDDDMLEILQLRGMRVSKSELSAFFRNPNQSQYRVCHDQLLRNFLFGMQLKYRPDASV